MRISDWSSDVCSSDLLALGHEVEFGNAGKEFHGQTRPVRRLQNGAERTCDSPGWRFASESAGPLDTIATRSLGVNGERGRRSEEHTSELQSLMRISYAVFCLKKQINTKRS